jgi:hypothetical protein
MVYYINRENNTLLLKGILHTPLFILIKIFSTVLPYLTMYNAQLFAQKIHWTSYVCIIHKTSVRLYTNTCSTLIILWNVKRWVCIIYKCVLYKDFVCIIYKCVLYKDIYGTNKKLGSLFIKFLLNSFTLIFLFSNIYLKTLLSSLKIWQNHLFLTLKYCLKTHDLIPVRLLYTSKRQNSKTLFYFYMFAIYLFLPPKIKSFKNWLTIFGKLLFNMVC